MKKSKSLSTISFIIVLCIMTAIIPYLVSPNLSRNHLINTDNATLDNIQNSDGISNPDIIETMINKYINDYDSSGIFSSYYEPSLQGIYFVLSVLNASEKLNIINQTELSEIIMSYYDENTGIFLDEYARRYLDTDFELKYYPLSTLLEVNSYAILSLEILGELDLINSQDMIDFIWSCYDSSTGGFIGQLYDTNLHENFKTPTLDNTYYAIKTLDILLENWQGYSTQKTQIINFIQDLQVIDQGYELYGGFENDMNEDFLSIVAYGPNMLSSYYAVKALKIFGVESSINMDLFYHFLSNSYHQNGDYFVYDDYNIYLNYSIFAATAMGLDLSILMGYTGINETETLRFLLNNRNELGIWDSTTYYGFYELLDTFQIIRSLLEANKISELSTEDKNEIVNAMEMFESYRGYSFTSKEYMKIDLMYSIIHSCALYDRISDLELQDLYLYFKQAYYDLQSNDWSGFYGYTNIDKEYKYFRLLPIEFYNEGMHNFSIYMDYHNNHKFTYRALSSLEKLFKLDDFETIFNLTELIESIENCQIMEETSDYFGAFIPFEFWKSQPLADQEKMIFFEQTYFAIKTLAYLTEYLGIGNISNTNVDLDAVYTYTLKNIEETPQILYYNPECTDNPEIILKNTYYLIDLFKLMNEYSLPDQKIKNLVLQTINYSNIESVFYSYKIDESLSLQIEFDLDQTHSLIKSIFDEKEQELYLTPQQEKLNYEILYWLSYMAVNDEYRCIIDYDTTVQLNGCNYINASICNIVLEGLGPYAILKLESEQLGTHTFDETGEGNYEYIANVPLDPANYPIVYANVCLYEASQRIKGYPFSFTTEYIFDSLFSVSNSTDTRDIVIQAHLSTATGNVSLYNGIAYVDIYRNGEFVQKKFLNMQDYADHTEFIDTISYNLSGEYRLELYVNDGLETSYHHIGTYIFTYIASSDSVFSGFPFLLDMEFNTEKNNVSLKANSMALFPLFISLIALPIGIIAYTTYRKKKRS